MDCLKDGLKIYGKPHIFNTDQGSQFTSLSFTGELKSNDILISMDSKGRALDNIIIERFWRTLKYDYLYLNAFEDGWALQKGIAEFIQFYNYQRKHQSLAYLTPAQVYLQKMIPTFKNTKIAQPAITLLS